MSKLDYYVLHKFVKEIKSLGYDYNDLETLNIWKFRYICMPRYCTELLLFK